MNKKYLLFLLILFISIGFAYLSTNLNITGSSLIKGNTWDVHFENVQVTSGSVSATTPTISTDKKSVNYIVTLDMPGDYFEFTVDAVNAGTIDAMVDTVSNTGLTEDQLKYLDYKVELNNGDPLEHGYILLQGSRKTYKVRLEYKLDIDENDLPDSDQSLDLTFTVNYVQTDESAYTTATFDTGVNVAAKMIQLSNSNEGSNEGTAKVKAFLKGTEVPNNLTNDNIVSISESDEPIYLWFEEDEEDDGTGAIYWYSEADVVFLNKDSSNMFFYYYETDDNYEQYYFQKLTDISGLDSISTLKVQDISYMFAICTSLNNISALSNWNTSNVEDMSGLFYALPLSNISVLSNWNTSSLKDISRLFLSTKIDDISPLSNWNISKVEDMSELFENCSSLTDLTPLSNWNTSSVKSLSCTFQDCTSLTNLTGLENWDIRNVIYMSGMFNNCTNLVNASGINSWGTRLNTNLNYTNMFSSSTTTLPSWYV